MHEAHLAELIAIWAVDKRMPSVASRRTWAAARGLNPARVHAWWCRRRAIEKKRRVKMEKGTYELDVGTPPIIVVAVKREDAEDDGRAGDGSLSQFIPSDGDGGAVGAHATRNGMNMDSDDADNHLPSDATLVCAVSDKVSWKRSAYTRFSSSPEPLMLRSVSSICSRASTLPPSSPPLPSSPLCFPIASTESETPKSKCRGILLLQPALSRTALCID